MLVNPREPPGMLRVREGCTGRSAGVTRCAESERGGVSRSARATRRAESKRDVSVDPLEPPGVLRVRGGCRSICLSHQVC